MSMNVGSGGEDEPIMDINTTPLIDVMLVLLVMLIITIPIQLHSVQLNLPTGNPPPQLVKPEVLKIDIDASGVIYFNGEVIPDRATVEARFKTFAEQQVQPLVPPDRAEEQQPLPRQALAQRWLGFPRVIVHRPHPVGHDRDRRPGLAEKPGKLLGQPLRVHE